MKTFLRSWHPKTAAFVFAIWMVTSALTITLRAIRLYHRGSIKHVLVGVDVYKSDAFFLLAFLLVGLAGLYFTRNRISLQTAFFSCLVFVGLFTSGIESIAFRFFVATGSTIDFGLIWYSLENFEESWEVIRSEVPNWMFVLLGAIVVTYCTFPFIFARVWKKAVFQSPSSTRPLRPFAIAAILGATFFFCAFLPPFKEPARAFAKNATLHVSTTAVTSMFETTEAGTEAQFNTTLARLNGKSDWNVVIILLESTRASATTVHNPELKTTPFLKELSEKSLWLDRAYALVPHTSKALVAVLCGIPPRLHMPITEASPNGVPGRCLARLLRENGYQTSFFQSATQRFENRKQLVKDMGYNDFFPDEKLDGKDFVKANYFGKEDDIMLEPSREWLKKNKGKGPLFMTYLTLTPHHNYIAPRRYGRHEFSKKGEFNRYLNTIHYVDNFTKNVVEMFKEEGLYKKTVFVIVGDHGEGFGEHGRRQHDNVIWEEGIRVPLMIHKPGQFEKGRRVDYIGNQLDIIPTVMPLIGFDIKNAQFPGADLVTLDEQRTLFAHCWYEKRCMASIAGTEKFIYHFEQKEDEFYDLATDPKEKNNLVKTMENYDARRSELIAWRSGVNRVYNRHYRDRVENYVSKSKPSVENEVNVDIGEYVRVLGYDLSRDKVKPGQSVKLTTYYEVLKEVPQGYKLFMHGRGKGTKMSNFDHVPADGFYAVEDWKSGEFVTDKFNIRVPKNAKDEYVVTIGIYHPKKGRIELKSGGDSLKLVKIPVTPKKAKKPKPKTPKKPIQLKPKLKTPKKTE